jgi:hypothetical protein
LENVAREEPLPGPPLKGRGQNANFCDFLLPSLQGRAGERFFSWSPGYPNAVVGRDLWRNSENSFYYPVTFLPVLRYN